MSPLTERASQLLKARTQGSITMGHTGAWLKERQPSNIFFVNVGALTGRGEMRSVHIFEFGDHGLVSTTRAERGQVGQDGHWELASVERNQYQVRQEPPRIERQNLPEFRWATGITADMVSASLLKPDTMRTIDLFQYIRHLNANDQTSQKYEIEFWRKVFYPLSCLVMVVLALPFAYLHFRSGGIATYVFGGVMAGISFFLLNNVFGYIGNLQNWAPWLTAAAPGLIYSALSLAAFGWLVLRR